MVPPYQPPQTPPPFPAVPPAPTTGNDLGMRLLLPVGRSGWAIAAGYLGLLSLALIPAPIAIIISIIAIRDVIVSQITPQRKYGLGRAIFGLIMGLIGSTLLVILLSDL